MLERITRPPKSSASYIPSFKNHYGQNIVNNSLKTNGNCGKKQIKGNINVKKV